MNDPIYISGPMTGYEDFNRKAFNHLEEYHVELGHIVKNPASVIIANGTWQDYMREDISLLMESESVEVLKGWEHSNGSRIETLLAAVLRIPVYPNYLEKPIPRSEIFRIGIGHLLDLYREALIEEQNGRWEQVYGKSDERETRV